MLAEQIFLGSAGAFKSKSFGGGHELHGPGLIGPLLHLRNYIERILFENRDLPVFRNLFAVAKVRPGRQVFEIFFG